MSARWLWGVFFWLVLIASMPASAQVRCTMPNGVVITQQLGDCPRGAVSAQRLDGTPVRLSTPKAAAIEGRSATPAPMASPMAASPGTGDGGGMSLASWLPVGLLALGLYWAVKGSAGVSGPVRYCATCGHEGKGKTHTRGSLLIEIVLWLCFLVPGLIYSLWRHASRHKVCASCGAAALVPLSSPVAVAARRALQSGGGATDGGAAFQPRAGESVTTAKGACAAFADALERSGYARKHKSTLRQTIADFQQEMNEHEEELRSNIAYLKEEIAKQKDYRDAVKDDISEPYEGATGDVSEYAEKRKRHIAHLGGEIDQMVRNLARDEALLKAFVSDRRGFVDAYVAHVTGGRTATPNLARRRATLG